VNYLGTQFCELGNYLFHGGNALHWRSCRAGSSLTRRRAIWRIRDQVIRNEYRYAVLLAQIEKQSMLSSYDDCIHPVPSLCLREVKYVPMIAAYLHRI